MIHSINASGMEFKPVIFRPGMNIIVAERTETKDRQTAQSPRRTRNGAGKSSIIDIVHFLLAGKAEGALQADALKQWAFWMELNVGDAPFIVRRSVAEARNVLLKNQISGKEQSITNVKWADFLGLEWFGLTPNKQPGAASFRQLISYFARRRRDGGYDSPVRTFRAQNNAVSETNLALLFGLDAEVVRRFHQAKAALKQNEAAQKALSDIDKNSPTGKRRIDLEAQLSAQIAASTLARDNLKEKIEAFNVLPAFRELEGELATLNQQARDLSDQDVLDQEIIGNSELALESELATDMPQLEKLFAEAKIVFPDAVNRRYEEVTQFHKRLIENRRAHLLAEIKAASHRIDDRQFQREALETRRRQITGALRSTGPADELLRLRDELAEKDAAVRALEARLMEARNLEARGEEIQRQLEDYTRALRQDRRERSSLVDHASRTFSEISERLYEMPGQLAISATERGLQFAPTTPSDQSAGVMSMEIFCFDLTISALCKSRGLGPGFLIHDSHLFEPVDGRQFARALRIASRFASDNDIQYIVTLNSDELDRAEKEGHENFRDFVINPVLSDAPDGGLFGFRFD